MENTQLYKTLEQETMQWSLYIPLWPVLTLVQIPGDAGWLTVLDLKDGCLLLHPSSSLTSVSCLLLSGLTPTWAK